MVRIVEIGDIVWQGKTEPVIYRAEDGHEYVVKGRFAGRKALIAEWLANRLGRLLGLPIPEFEQFELDSSLWKYTAKSTEANHLGPGVLFGSRRVANVVEIRQADVARLDMNLQARVLAFDWWIANADRVFVDGAGNPNLLWAQDHRRLVVIDHNLAFEPALMGDFWSEHAFREARSLWSETFCAWMAAQFRSSLVQLPAIWRELPGDWIDVESGLPLAFIESLPWKFDREADIFWHRS